MNEKFFEGVVAAVLVVLILFVTCMGGFRLGKTYCLEFGCQQERTGR